ncbi:MAG TPA: hypothetical protein VIL20_01285 [Sandaracinaceae bacterium]
MKKALLGAVCALLSLIPAAEVLAQAPGGDEQPSSGEPPEAAAPEAEAPRPSAGTETVCDDRQDDDGDGLADCADADCFENERCMAGGQEERTDDRCSDWIDNDGDALVDCEDPDCSAEWITVCRGSWTGRPPGAGHGAGPEYQVPELTGDMSVEDLIGRGSDADGERNDYTCSDGVDNDGDGRTDCQDFGCRFDPSVTVCANPANVRFGVVAGVAAALRISETPDIDGDGMTEYGEPTGDVRFTRLQLRALGPIPFIQNSFFLINVRAERTFRLTFANFTIPLGNEGHYLSINSGSGGLSPGLIVSTSKQPLLDPPYYLFNDFERGSGAAVEVGGPLTSDGTLGFRVFGAGGSGEFSGNVGGRFFRSDDRNFSYAGGAQLQINLAGRYNRFDTPFLYTPVPLTAAVMVGGRFDQRAVERYPAWNVFGILRYGHFLLRAEHYGRYVLDFDGVQTAWNVQASVLLVPRMLMLAADVGGLHMPLAYDERVVDSIGGYSGQFHQPTEIFQVRGALHWYYFRNIGILSLLYSLRFECALREVAPNQFTSTLFGACRSSDADPDAPITEHEVRLEAQFRF